MWVLSVDAGTLLSVVKFDISKAGADALAKKHGATDPNVDYLMVRARWEPSLKYVCDVLDAISEDLPGYVRPIIEDSKSADYQYRTIVTREEWKRYLMFEVDGIDYDSHVKEETVKRQPEPKHPNLYSALIGTWNTWSKLQPNPPYGGSTYVSKPDCKNCDHTELSHSVKGDQCNKGAQWVKGAQMRTCPCTKYEPKPVPKKADKPEQLEIGASQPDPTYPASVYGSNWDVAEDQVAEWVGEDGQSHTSWCSFWDGDSCICKDPEDDAADEDNWLRVGEHLVYQEPAVEGETKRMRKSRNERNRRRRQKARRRQDTPQAI